MWSVGSMILAKAFLDGGIRAYVGKLSMDMSPVRAGVERRQSPVVIV